MSNKVSLLSVCCMWITISVAAEPAKTVVEIPHEVRISEPTVWKDSHYKIRGSLVFEKGGVLTLENSTVELMSSYSREFEYLWKGGTLISNNATVGGTLKDGAISQAMFTVADGVWESTDTMVRYTYGIWVGAGKIRAKNLIQGPNPDAICVSEKGDVILTDCRYDITLNLYAGRKPQKVTLDLPVKTPITKVYDGQNVPGAEYRLELINTTVPNWWFLFMHGVTMDGPPLDVTLGDCPSLIPAILGNDLKGTAHLPVKWTGQAIGKPPAPITIGNLTLRSLKDRELLWAIYLSGDKTDFTIRGPTFLAELCVYGGKVLFLGEEGTYNAHTTATTVDVGRSGQEAAAALVMRNASITPVNVSPGLEYGNLVVGQINASGNGVISLEHCELAPITLVTRDKGTISLRDIKKCGGDPKLMEQGGPIRFLDTQ